MGILQREKLSNRVYAVIKQMIADYRFQPGTRLNVEQLAKEMGVSRTPVWEAISRLEQEGLVETIPNRGVFMAVLTPEKALDLYAVRESLEGVAGRLAAQHISEDSLKAMEANLEKQEQVIARSDLIGYSQLDFEFHAIVYEASGNPVLQELLETIKNKMRPLSLEVEPYLSQLFEDHRCIIEALRTGDPFTAEEVFVRHNRRMIELIKSRMITGAMPKEYKPETESTLRKESINEYPEGQDRDSSDRAAE